jgi:hypothetical protein
VSRESDFNRDTGRPGSGEAQALTYSYGLAFFTGTVTPSFGGVVNVWR